MYTFIDLPFSNLVFDLFLYPYFEKGTISVNNFGLVEILFRYLHECCTKVDTVMRIGKIAPILIVSSGAGALHFMNGGTPAYSISKLNALTRILAAEVRGTNILINAIDPGWVTTDMGGNGGRPVEEGARGIVWASTLPDDGPSGGFFYDGKPVPW
jgi:NAD(P)-dependent dehydrogenase (short-subunit alcohol dehydrogenase family)